MNKIKIFQINDYDWVAAETIDEAIACACSTFNLSEEEVYDESAAGELSEEKLDEYKYYLTDDTDGPSRTFKQELESRINDKQEFPQVFATSEW